MKPIFTLRSLDVQLYRACDDLSGALLLPMLVFSPWAFGTTQPWSIQCMNLAGYALGVLLLIKLFIRNLKGYPAPRWDRFSPRSGTFSSRRRSASHLPVRVLGWLTLSVLAYILISAVNVGANYQPEVRVFEYLPHVHWLPFSLDGQRTWRYFWMYLGLAASFWAAADWLPGLTATEERSLTAAAKSGLDTSAPLLSARLRTMLWLLCLDGALLGIEGIVQRAVGSTKLLFLAQPTVNPQAIAQFGPYAYRSNAAQYFDLLWPVCLGFWWTLQRSGGLRFQAQHWLLGCAAIMAACPIISASRAGALTSVGLLVLALLYIAATGRFGLAGRKSEGAAGRGPAVLLLLFVALTLGLGWYFGWASLEPRLEQFGEGYQVREAMYEAAQPMARDYPLFGTGPGTFGTVFQLYRYSEETYWPEQLHDDWLETRITFGWVGFLLLLSALACVAWRWFVPGGMRGSRRLVVLAWLSLGGCLVQARFDFPFQIHSTLFLFLLICAMLLGLSRYAATSRK